MDLIKFKNFGKKSTKNLAVEQSSLAEIVLKSIHDGVIMTDKAGIVQFINPAAATMTEYGSSAKATGLSFDLVIKLESKEGREFTEKDNPLIVAMKNGQDLEPTQVALVASTSGKRIPISISMHLADGMSQNRVITFRDITKELEEEGEQTEFISTASHEMRTPVATIDGYISLCLNPQTATIDERARGFLTSAQGASKHLGQLFHDLLDVTRLDDGRARTHFEPIEMVEFVKNISNDYLTRANENKVTLNFGSGGENNSSFGDAHRMSQLVYCNIDIDFLREVLDNLIENAIKYTPAGGSIYVNVRGDGDRVLINVTDTGIGISADDLSHIFQKFYRADNSDTREIGGTGLGLYLVKQRVEALGGRVWAESAFGEGSTFYVSLPRISHDEYEKLMIAKQNQALRPDTSTSKPLDGTPNNAPANPSPEVNSFASALAQASGPAQAPAPAPTTAQASSSAQAPAPAQAPISAPTPAQAPAPASASAQAPATAPNPISAQAPAPTTTPPAPASVPAPAPIQASVSTPATPAPTTQATPSPVKPAPISTAPIKAPAIPASPVTVAPVQAPPGASPQASPTTPTQPSQQNNNKLNGEAKWVK